ncbi:hypothetical protein [Reyranella sp.]|uniref:sunset domain-containing protein n=1 Tax=Reyranella sp. TaxID=1929291 RepID=UPI003BABD8AF
MVRRGGLVLAFCLCATPAAAQAPVGQQCLIKGNVNGKGERIYHPPGCRYYNATAIDPKRGERWFCSEQEAVAAGWRRTKVC